MNAFKALGAAADIIAIGEVAYRVQKWAIPSYLDWVDRRSYKRGYSIKFRNRKFR